MQNAMKSGFDCILHFVFLIGQNIIIVP